MIKKRFYIQTAASCFELSPAAFYVYSCLCKHANADGICFPSRGVIVKHTGLCKSSITKAVRELSEKGLITYESQFQLVKTTGRNRQTSNLYHILDLG